MGFRDLSCDLAGGLLYTKWPLDVHSLGHRDVIARDSVTWHTLLYDRARSRPRPSDRAGVRLYKCYNSIDSMVVLYQELHTQTPGPDRLGIRSELTIGL